MPSYHRIYENAYKLQKKIFIRVFGLNIFLQINLKFAF